MTYLHNSSYRTPLYNIYEEAWRTNNFYSQMHYELIDSLDISFDSSTIRPEWLLDMTKDDFVDGLFGEEVS